MLTNTGLHLFFVLNWFVVVADYDLPPLFGGLVQAQLDLILECENLALNI